MQGSRLFLNVLLTEVSAEIWENSSIETEKPRWDEKHETF